MPLFRGKNKFSYIESVGTKIGFDDYTMPWGRTGYPNRFFVDPQNGSDTNDGRSWQYAFESFEAAIDAARFYYSTGALNYTDKSIRAFVFLAPGHYNETTELLWSGYNISVIGCTGVPGKDYGASFNYDGSTSATAVMLINGSGNELYNCYFYNDAAVPTLYLYYPGDNNLIHGCHFECDGSTATYGIYAETLKGSKIEDCVIRAPITAGIAVIGGDNHYAIDGHIKDCSVYCATDGAIGIDVGSGVTTYNYWLDRNRVCMVGGTSDVGIKCQSNVYLIDNFVSVPASATPVSHSGGEQYVIDNHTVAGTTTANPYYANG